MKRGGRILTVFWLLQPLSGMAAEQAMGRLFFTPGQRARMDVARQQEPGVNLRADQQESESPPAHVTLNGMVSSSDGKTTVWLNNRPESSLPPGRGITFQGKSRQVKIQARDGRASVPLKVGQSLDMASGRVEEAYRRAPPAPPLKASARPAEPHDATPAPPEAADVGGGTSSP